MNLAGFVLAGGQSARMGRDKALLSVNGQHLVQRVADQVKRAAGGAVILGDPARYGFLGYPVIPDLRSGCGPLGGLEAALSFTDSDWNLIVACDLGNVKAELLWALAEQTGLAHAADCVLPVGPDGQRQPLSGLYRRQCLPWITVALNRGVRRVHDVLAALRVQELPVDDEEAFQNLNTPEEWNRYLHDRLN